MEFEKEFPSLNKKQIYVSESLVGIVPTDTVILRNGKKKKIKLAQEPNTITGKTYEYISGDVYSEESIRVGCLDKQRLVNSINKAVDKIEMYPYKQMKGLEKEAKESIKKDIKQGLGL